MICNGQTYCLDGDCVKQEKQADPDFQKAVSALSAAHEAAKSFTDFNSIFAGVKKTCDKFALGFLNCCTGEGWGKDIKLAQCSQEEKDLGSAKENLQTVYVGEYCKKDPLGICIEHRKAYCVFPSKLARIIQAQGRRDQLGIGFGDAENVNCRGLLREEFAQLDFNKIDFSDFYSDIAKKERIEDQGKLNQRVSEKMDKWAEEKKPHG
jgi:conjugal transfer mating pair stabilization protein TraN